VDYHLPTPGSPILGKHLPQPARDEEQSTTIAGQIQLAQFFICGSKGSDLADPFGLLLLPSIVALGTGNCSRLWISGAMELRSNGAAEPSAQGCLF